MKVILFKNTWVFFILHYYRHSVRNYLCLSRKIIVVASFSLFYFNYLLFNDV